MPAYPGLPCVSIINYPNFCSYLICSRSPAYYGSDMTPYLAVNLLLDVRNGNYILRIFSRGHLRGNIGSFEEFRVLINNSFLGSKPCHGTKDLETPQFSAECAKMLPKGAEGDRCSNCLDQINLANVEPKRVKEEQGEDINVLEIFDEKPEELFNEDNSIYEEEDHQERAYLHDQLSSSRSSLAHSLYERVERLERWFLDDCWPILMAAKKSEPDPDMPGHDPEPTPSETNLKLAA